LTKFDYINVHSLKMWTFHTSHFDIFERNYASFFYMSVVLKLLRQLS